MKIISINESTSIENVLFKELLIPARVYKIPISVKNNDLNFLEETILKLIKIDKNLEVNDIVNLLGLDGKEDLVKFILDKLNSIEETLDNDEKIFFFYQELISGKPINLITKKIEEFYYVQSEKWSSIENVKNIIFEKNNKKISAFSFKYNKTLPYLTQEDLMKIIVHNNLNNKNFSNFITKIPTHKLSNLDLNDNEIMYLNVKIFIPKNNRDIILVTDGFNGGFSALFSEIINFYYHHFVIYLKSLTQINIYDKFTDDIELPFGDKINNYFEIKNLIKNIEINYQKYLNENNSVLKTKIKKNILKDLFDVLEKAFFELSKDLKYSKLITKDKIIAILQKDFLIDKNMNIFNISITRNNLQKYLALAIFYKKEEINRLHKKTFIFLEKLLNYRNDLKHSTDVDADNIDIEYFINVSYKIISKILNIKLIKKGEVSIPTDNENELIYNAVLDIEKEFIEVLDVMDSYVKDKLSDINFAIDELDFSRDSIKYAVENIYSLFEYMFKKYPFIEKNEILSKYNNLPYELKNVRLKNSLGRYYLNYLYIHYNEELTNFIAYIIRLRGHGNEFINLSKDELKTLKKQTFDYIKYLLKERK